MSEGQGLSSGEVQSIARDEAERVVAPVEREVAGLRSSVDQLSRRVVELEAEMGAISNAIDRMAQDLSRRVTDVARELAELTGTAKHQLEASRATEKNTGHLVVETAAGFVATTTATALVGTKVSEGTRANAELEYVRQLNAVRAPLRLIGALKREVDERFAKAMEDVCSNRALYDSYFDRVADEHDKKMRAIGDHIYAVVEQDYVPIVQRRAEVPRLQHHQRALEVDHERLAARSEALDADFVRVHDELLQPILGMQALAESRLAKDFAMRGFEHVEVAIPLNVVVEPGAGGLTARCLASAVVEREPDGALGVKSSSEAAEVEGLAEGLLQRVLPGLALRKLDSSGIEALIRQLERLAAEGRVEVELLPGYAALLRTHGLMVVDEGLGSAGQERS